MNDLIILRTPSEDLRTLINISGYRPYFANRGLDKDLDDLALDKRRGSNFELLHQCQAEWLRAVFLDCGAAWHDLINSAWQRHSDLLRSFARDTDTTGMIKARAKGALLRLLVIPGLSGFIWRASREIPLLDAKSWWETPFSAWLQAAASQSDLPKKQLLERFANHLGIDQRTLERWQRGSSVGKGLWPYRTTMQALFPDGSLTVNQAEQLTGWLVMAVAMQSLSAGLRANVMRDFLGHDQHRLKSEQQVRVQLKREAADRSSLPLRNQIAPVLDEFNQLFINNILGNAQRIRERLDWLRALYERHSPAQRAAHEYLWLWLTARLEANLGGKKRALELYEAACRQAWWRVGPNQHAILHEALSHAVGVGDKVRAKHYWDKCFLLGLNNPPKQELDDQEMRRLSFGFERLFPTQKACRRIPPALRFEVIDKPFLLSSKDIANPNRKRAQAEGRIRYTPLMNAVMQGSLEDVQQAIQAGGDPNVFIKESGENALIMALRRAYDQKDPEILNYLLKRGICPDTANRPASTRRETPLQIAMNMADAKIVGRLIDLGADVEQSCFTSPSALVYAMSLLHDSTHASDTSQRRAYLEGRVPADVFDAKGGAILDCELPAQRQAMVSSLDEPWKRRVFEAVEQYYCRPIDACRKVVLALLKNGADPNRRYRDFNGNRSHWTPTLLAAQVGDLVVLKAMIEAGGNPWMTLEEDAPLGGKDALWVAVAYQRHAVVEYLLTMLPRHLM
ncbi:ankyrin repeat domain-containing protein [Halomonas sp. Bachu 37]|uniref:ankyrin repeat domain-containing protein n=1 Tax=Halomonas kashgarensis TaxID=3084920 RepID=UPI0032166183